MFSKHMTGTAVHLVILQGLAVNAEKDIETVPGHIHVTHTQTNPSNVIKETLLYTLKKKEKKTMYRWPQKFKICIFNSLKKNVK